MGRAAAAVALLIGCGAPAGSTPVEPADLMGEEDFAWRISGLRATLARSDVAMDDGSTLRTCEGHHGEAGECVRCEVATRADTSGVDPEMIDAVAIAFARYPSKVLTAAELARVALCRRIRFEGDDPDDAPAGVADLSARRMLISIEHFVGRPHDRDAAFTIEQVVHHELFHLFDHAQLGAAMQRDRAWHQLNPRGFEYRDPATATERPAGFVNAYATTNEVEDRASVFEYLMGHPAELCAIAEADPIVAKKARVVWRRFAKVAGDAFLARQAPCLRQKARPKPKAKPKARPRTPRAGFARVTSARGRWRGPTSRRRLRRRRCRR